MGTPLTNFFGHVGLHSFWAVTDESIENALYINLTDQLLLKNIPQDAQQAAVAVLMRLRCVMRPVWYYYSSRVRTTFVLILPVAEQLRIFTQFPDPNRTLDVGMLPHAVNRTDDFAHELHPREGSRYGHVSVKAHVYWIFPLFEQYTLTNPAALLSNIFSRTSARNVEQPGTSKGVRGAGTSGSAPGNTEDETNANEKEGSAEDLVSAVQSCYIFDPNFV